MVLCGVQCEKTSNRALRFLKIPKLKKPFLPQLSRSTPYPDPEWIRTRDWFTEKDVLLFQDGLFETEVRTIEGTPPQLWAL